MQHEDKLHWFDLIRGVAALAVLVGHLRALLFTDYQDNSTPGLLGYGFYFITGFGHQAVVVFFVLSGFFIIRSIHESVVYQKWSPWLYSFNRLSRLWVVLIPSFLATLAWDTLGMHFFSDATVYAGSIPTLPGLNPEGKLGFDTFIGNVFFLQTIWVQTFGTNGALWSLANEFWYYLLFPLFYFLAARQSSWQLRLILIALVVFIYYLIGWGIATGFAIWLMGGITYLAFRSRWPASNRLLLRFFSAAVFLMVLVCIRIKVLPLIFNDYSLGLSTAFLLSTLIKASMPSKWLQKLALGFSEISYSLYLFHLSFAVFISAFLVPVRQAFSLQQLALYLALLTVILGYSVVMYYLFERNTGRIKKAILHFYQPKNS